MKLIKFTSILLCFLMIAAMFASCTAPDGNKTNVSKNDTGENASEVPEEVSPQESETAEKIEPWGTDYDWDFLKGWPIHHDYVRGTFNNTWEPYPNYSTEFHDKMKYHEQYDVLLHIAMVAHYTGVYDGDDEKIENKYNFADEKEISAWLKAGNIPLEIQSFDVEGVGNIRFFCGYLSFADIEKLIEYSEEYGYFLHFEAIHINENDDMTDEMFDCPYCNENKQAE